MDLKIRIQNYILEMADMEINPIVTRSKVFLKPQLF